MELSKAFHDFEKAKREKAFSPAIVIALNMSKNSTEKLTLAYNYN